MNGNLDLAAYASDRYIIVCIALFAEAMVGRISWLFRIIPHPNDVLERLAGFFGSRLDRSRRGTRALIVRGAIVALFLSIFAFLTGWVLAHWAAGYSAGWLLDLVLLVLLISQCGTYGEASGTLRALTRYGLEAGRKRAAAFHRGEGYRLDSHGVCRTLAQHLAGSFGRRLIGPIFWYYILGIPGLLLHAMVLAMSRQLARHEPARDRFGWLADRLERVLGTIPGWIAGQIVVLSAVFAPTARPVAACRLMYRTAAKLSPPTFGWPVAGFAGALSFELGGPNSVEGRRLSWFGQGTPRLSERDAHRALMLFGYCCVVNAVLALGLALANFALSG